MSGNFPTHQDVYTNDTDLLKRNDSKGDTKSYLDIESSIGPSCIDVHGGKSLSGSVRINGAKNAALPIMVATSMVDGAVLLRGLPYLSDVMCMFRLLQQVGASGELNVNTHPPSVETLSAHEQQHHRHQFFHVDYRHNSPLTAVDKTAPIIIGKEAQALRASILLLGPALARGGSIILPYPGGDPIGKRPVDFHVKVLQQMGARVICTSTTIEASAPQKLCGVHTVLPFPSVGATENIMMAATLARGISVISGAAQEPEIQDLATFLNAAGAKIDGAGTETITITGVDKLHGCEHRVIPDRIEALSYLVLAVICGDGIVIEGIDEKILGNKLLETLVHIGVRWQQTTAHNGQYSWKVAHHQPNSLSSTSIETAPYPGIPTDVQAQMTVLLAHAQGKSRIHERIFENRYGHIKELCAMGARIGVENNCAVVEGTTRFSPATVYAEDIRSSFALMVAALSAHGVSRINGMRHLYRGYANLIPTLKNLGATLFSASPNGSNQ